MFLYIYYGSFKLTLYWSWYKNYIFLVPGTGIVEYPIILGLLC